MSVIDRVGPFTLHAVGDSKPWIKWTTDVNDLWIQYFMPVLAYTTANISNPIELRWKSRTDSMSYSYNLELVEDLLSDNEFDAYTNHIKSIRCTIENQIGYKYGLERCTLECDEDGVALLDELNSSWIHYRLTRNWDDT